MSREEFEARVGTRLRRKWMLERLLGIGGMSAVYAARHRIGRVAAIKILRPEVAVDPQLRERFAQEASAVNSVGHPGAVEILDMDEDDDGTQYLVMELLEGETLADRAERNPGPDLDTLLGYVDQTLDVLVACHKRGVIHRDIKPENLFIQRNGRIKVLDFGIARVREGVKTTAGTMLGTVAFMPPEQLRGETVDARADLFALGATMFSVLTGRRIHPAKDDAELAGSMLTKPAPPLASVIETVPERACWVVDRALAFLPDRRYPDAQTMRGDVWALQRDGPPPYANACRQSGLDPHVIDRERPTRPERDAHGELPSTDPQMPAFASMPTTDPQMPAFAEEAGSSPRPQSPALHTDDDARPLEEKEAGDEESEKEDANEEARDASDEESEKRGRAASSVSRIDRASDDDAAAEAISIEGAGEHGTPAPSAGAKGGRTMLGMPRRNAPEADRSGTPSVSSAPPSEPPASASSSSEPPSPTPSDSEPSSAPRPPSEPPSSAPAGSDSALAGSARSSPVPDSEPPASALDAPSGSPSPPAAESPPPSDRPPLSDPAGAASEPPPSEWAAASEHDGALAEEAPMGSEPPAAEAERPRRLAKPRGPSGGWLLWMAIALAVAAVGAVTAHQTGLVSF